VRYERSPIGFSLKKSAMSWGVQLRDTFRKEFPLDKDGNQGWQLKESIGFVHDLIKCQAYYYVFVSVILNSVFYTCGLVYCWSLCTREFKNSCSYTTKKRIVGEGN